MPTVASHFFFLILVFTRARAFVYNIYNIILYILLLWLKCIHRRKSFILYIYSLPCLRVPTNTHAQHTHANCDSGHCCRKCSRFCEWQRSASPATHTNGNSTSICINFFFYFFYILHCSENLTVNGLAIHAALTTSQPKHKHTKLRLLIIIYGMAFSSRIHPELAEHQTMAILVFCTFFFLHANSFAYSRFCIYTICM